MKNLKNLIYGQSAEHLHSEGSQNLDEANQFERKDYLLGRIPQWNRRFSQINLINVKRANRYLKRQEYRITKALNNGNFDKAYKIWIQIFRRSYSYQIRIFNSCFKGWYWNLNYLDLTNTLESCRRAAVRLDFFLEMNRFYILKADGVRWRPIGAPTPKSTFISHFLTDMTYGLTKHSFAPFQHGFRRGKGTHTALKQVLNQCWSYNPLSPIPIWEFDFKSFFNNVSIEEIRQVLHSKTNSFMFATLVSETIYAIKYRSFAKSRKLSAIKPEEELKMEKRRILHRKGLPQGLSLSPLLASIQLEALEFPANLIMYADDGIIIGEDQVNSTKEWLKSLERRGIKIAPEKTGFIRNARLKFLGVEFNFANKTAQYLGGTFSWGLDPGDDPSKWLEAKEKQLDDFENWLRGKSIKYQHSIQIPAGKKRWFWWIATDSIATKVQHKSSSMIIHVLLLIVSLPWYICIWVNSIFGRTYEGMRFCLSNQFTHIGIYDILSTSSRSCEYLLKNSRLFKLKKPKRGISKIFDKLTSVSQQLKVQENLRSDGTWEVATLGLLKKGAYKENFQAPLNYSEYTIENMHTASKSELHLNQWGHKTSQNGQPNGYVFGLESLTGSAKSKVAKPQGIWRQANARTEDTPWEF